MSKERADELETGSDVFGFDAMRGVQAGREFYVAMCPMKIIPKLFVFSEVDLPPEVRAQRRHSELLVLGHKISYESVLREIQERDERDTNREQSPLLPAEDANKIDTSDMNIGEVYDLVCLIIDAKLEK